MDRSDAVVDKRELLEEVWGADFTGDPNIVEVYVGYLRRKIDQPFETSTLLTVRGVGYRLVARVMSRGAVAVTQWTAGGARASGPQRRDGVTGRRIECP